MRAPLRFFWLLALAFLPATPAQTPVSAAPASSELVVLLHGMGRTAWSMGPVEDALQRAGYDVLNIGYSSYCCDVEELGEALRREIAARRGPEHDRLHFVTHSLGGIIVRWILTREARPPGVQRLVMLAPPNRGAQAADRFAPLVGWILEPIDELRTDRAATVHQLPSVEGVTIGIIAGKDDDKVALEETRLAEAADHVLVGGGHTFMMWRDDVQALTVAFLRDGHFPPDAERPHWSTSVEPRGTALSSDRSDVAPAEDAD